METRKYSLNLSFVKIRLNGMDRIGGYFISLECLMKVERLNFDNANIALFDGPRGSKQYRLNFISE